MLTATEYFLSKALRESLREAKSYLEEKRISSSDKEKTYRRSFEQREVIDSYIKRINTILSLYKPAILESEKLDNIAEFKKHVSDLVDEKVYSYDSIDNKIETIEKADGEIEEELNRIIYESEVTKESSRYVSFVCPKEKIEKYFIQQRGYNIFRLGDKDFILRGTANSNNSKIFYILKGDFLDEYNLKEGDLAKAKTVKEIKKEIKDAFDIYFAPSKLGLAPIFEADYAKKDHEDNKEFLYFFTPRGGVERLEYYNVLDLLKLNFIPHNIVKKQVKGNKAGVVYTNGWFNSGLINKEKLEKAVKSDQEWEDKTRVEEYNQKWKNVYKEGKKQSRSQK